MLLNSAARKPTPTPARPSTRRRSEARAARRSPGAVGESAASSAQQSWTARLKAWLQGHRCELWTYAVSAIFHATLALCLWYIVIERHRDQPIDTMILLQDRDVENPPELTAIEPPERINDPLRRIPQDVAARVVADMLAPVNVQFEDEELALRPDVRDPLGSVIPNLSDHFGGRASASTREALVAQFGGNAASEQAVLWGLEWLARHQSQDGSWSFDHVAESSVCSHDCTMPGQLTDCRMGATSLALLCFLGAGHTYESGDFQPQVKSGIDYLINNMQVSRIGGDLRGGFVTQGMYVQGLAAIALCEAHAMTSEVRHDRIAQQIFAEAEDPAGPPPDEIGAIRLRAAAEQAIAFIVRAQHEHGGWRYVPGQRGDTSVVGWQVMALESARSGRIRVAPGTLVGAGRFLNRVQIERGARYGYEDNRREGTATTAVGLLCRMYLGWRRDSPALGRGVGYLSRRGPSRDDMYYNYYATQVLHHWGGEEWNKWNAVMRDRLIDAQDTAGHAHGSWRPTMALGSSHGGRLYQTTLSIMTLEVYYRHLPLYRDRDLDAVLEVAAEVVNPP